MFGWLLFFPPAEVKGAHAMQLGLGAGTITKFCYKKLKMTCTAVELNPGVLHACRGWFRLPPDDERLRVVLADASLEIQKDEWRGTVDALQVDLYDEEAAAPVLDTPDFYRNCRELLTQQGCMTRCGPSSPRAKAMPSCWRSAPPIAPRAKNWNNVPLLCKRSGAGPLLCGSRCSSPWSNEWRCAFSACMKGVGIQGKP
jgi:hypothetical protein